MREPSSEEGGGEVLSAIGEPAGSGADRHGMVVRAAWLYYKDGLTQAEIARRLEVSRPTVGRLLDTAREQAIVRFEISTDHLASFELSKRLRARFNLADAIVVPRVSLDSEERQTNQRLAEAAAGYLGRFLAPGAVIGVGWGDTVMRVLVALTRESLTGVTIGAVAGGIEAYTREVTRSSSNGLTEHLRLIPAPLVASSAKIAEALREDDSVTSGLRLAESAVATLTGIGSNHPGASSIRAGLFTSDQVDTYRELGAVGDMLGEWFSADGEAVRGPGWDCRIGMSIDELRARPNVIGVAGGVEKVEAIAGALHGGYLDVLVTDEDVAERLLER
jgi:lsr operon transcriptional repressor